MGSWIVCGRSWNTPLGEQRVQNFGRAFGLSAPKFLSKGISNALPKLPFVKMAAEKIPLLEQA